MILDLQSLFSDDQAITVSAASTNIIDLGATGTPPLSSTALTRDIGPGMPIDILIQVTVAHGGTSPLLDIDLEMDTVAAFSSATIVASAVQLSGAAVGDRASIRWIPDGTSERFIRLAYTAAGTSPTITVTAGIALGIQTRPY